MLGNESYHSKAKYLLFGIGTVISTFNFFNLYPDGIGFLETKEKWTEDFEAAHFFDTRSAAELRLAEENRVSENPHSSIVEVELYRD